MIVRSLYLIALFGAVFLSCKGPEDEATLRVGFSQCISNDQWRQSMHREMQRELLFYPELSLEIKDAEGSSDVQISHIEEFISSGVDLLIVSPNEAEPITSVVEKAFNSGIPVIVIDRNISSNLYTSYIGANNTEIGRTAGQYIKSILPAGSKVIEIWGLEGSTPAMSRHDGFSREVLDSYEIVPIKSDWTKESAKSAFRELIREHLDLDLVYAHNDQMALGAYEVCRDLGLTDVKFIGIDGLAGNSGGMQLVQNGILDATLLYPTGGEEAIRLAASVLRGKAVDKDNFLGTTIIDSENVRILKPQSDKILNQQRDIERQQQKISDQLELYQAQRSVVYILSAGLLVIFGLAIYLYYTRREKQRINLELAEKNEKVIAQQNEIIKYSEQAEEANSARFKFFTNISHEFRTPLTLILGPVEDLLSEPTTLSRKLKADLELIQKNSYRLLRMINQLMEYRKIENGKLKLQVSESDIVSFVSEIVEAFRSLSEQKKVDLTFHTEKESESVWFDENMLDKVIFNLLSNAFKFTPQGGFIKVYARILEDTIKLIVEDNGRGMSEEHAKHAFDRFYQGDKYAAKGTGLGLSLTKELIDLHRGAITLKSQKGLGTRFEITLPKGDSNLAKVEKSDGLKSRQIEGIEYVKQYADVSFVEEDQPKTDQTILIIEDNNDLLKFIRNYLSKYFTILTATTGAEGLFIAQEKVPDLVICDIMLDDVDGLSVTKKIKSDFRTSHISVILLTAKTSDEDKVLGMKSGADQYITKPFKVEYLLESVNAHLKNRELLKRHFGSEENDTDQLEDLPLNLDQDFISNFKRLVKDHISDPTTNVELFCRELGLSRVQLYRKVKALIGQSVNDYLNEVRLKHAKQLLHSDYSISEVAYQSGFSSPAYFSTAFRSKFKISPSEYKSSLSKS